MQSAGALVPTGEELFSTDGTAPGTGLLADLDQRAWLDQVAPVQFMFVNEHDITVVILRAPNGDLIRGEFHFDPAGDMVQVKGKVQLYQGALQMILTRIDTAPQGDYNADDFRAQPHANVGPLLERLKELISTIQCDRLRVLAACLLTDAPSRVAPEQLTDRSQPGDLSRSPGSTKQSTR